MNQKKLFECSEDKITKLDSLQACIRLLAINIVDYLALEYNKLPMSTSLARVLARFFIQVSSLERFRLKVSCSVR